MEPKDVLNNTIHVGDYVCYAQTSGHHSYFKFGKVLKLLNVDSEPFHPIIQIIGIERYEDKVNLCSRPGDVHWPNDRIMILPGSMINQEIKELLDSYSSSN